MRNLKQRWSRSNFRGRIDSRRKEIVNQMNEPLKFKLFSVYGQILHKKVLEEAWKHVKANKGCGGIDKISVKDFDKNSDKFLDDLLEELKTKTYKPSPVARKYIPKKNGKLRPLGIPTIKDRIVQQAVVNKLQPFFEEKVFHDNSCGFRPNRDVELAVKKVLCRIEYGYLYIYDFDIKGYFDNIPHKKLMKVLNKYVSDGTILDLVWKWLKAGYMEDNIRYEQTSGTQQGGVISPLLANIYLNELDWELDKAGLQFVRYADDSIVMCRSKEELEKAKEIVHEVLMRLGLALAEDKTDEIDFHDDDFDFLNFTFRHLKRSKKGNWYYQIEPSEKSIKKFKSDIKALTPKSNTLSFEQWRAKLNPIIRGKYNYFLISARACLAVKNELKKRGKKFHGYCYVEYSALDGYVRQRLRVNFSCRGKMHGGQRQGKLLCVKYSNLFFVKDMGLVCGRYLYNLVYNPNLTLEKFVETGKHKTAPSKFYGDRDKFFQYAYAK